MIMIEKNRSGFFVFVNILMGLCAVLFFLIKFGGPFFVEQIFDYGNIDLILRFLPDINSAPSLSLYLGLAEQEIFGPISQTFAAAFLIIFTLCYLQKVNSFYFGFCIFLFFLVTKSEVLFFPPYGDAIAGPFVEAIWLARHNFDYVGLFHQPDYAQGGARVYLFSIYPTYAAIWISILKHPVIFLPVMHLIVFMLFSAVASWIREIARLVMSNATAVLTSLLFLFMPLVQSQSESLNMEPPCMFFVFLSAYLIVHRKVFFALLAAIGAVLVKGTGIMACGSVALIVFILLIGGIVRERKIKKKYILYILLMAAIPLLKLFSKYFIGDAHVSAGMVGLFKGLLSLKIIMIVRWFLASLVIYMGFFIFNRKRLSEKFFSAGMMYVFAVCFFILLLNFSVVSPRYRLSVYPFLIFCVINSMSLILKNVRLQSMVIIIAILIAAFSSYGYFGSVVQDHVLLERSLEYRNDFYIDREIVKIVERRYQDFAIVAPMQLAQMFALEELGYIAKGGLNVFIYGFPCYYGGIKQFPGLVYLDSQKTIFIGKKSDADAKALLVPGYPIDRNDVILEEISSGNKKAWIFSGGAGVEKLYRTIYRIIKKYTI